MLQHLEFNWVYKIRNYLNYKSRSNIISIVTLKMEGRHPFFMCLEGRITNCQQSVSFILATSGQLPGTNNVSFLATIAHVTKQTLNTKFNIGSTCLDGIFLIFPLVPMDFFGKFA